MKVLFLHSQCENGGISRIVFSICDLLKKEGSYGKFIFSRGFIPNGHEDECDIVSDRISLMWHILMSRLFDSQGFCSRKITKKIIDKIEEYRPDVIHLNNVHGYYLDVELFFDYLKKVNIPVVWTLHDCWAFTGHCSHFEYYGCSKWKTGCKNCEHYRVYPKSWLISNSSNNYIKKKNAFTGVNNLTLVCPSHWLDSIVRDSFLGCYPRKVIPNGINLEKFMIRKEHPASLSEHLEKRIILAVASVWTQRKGYFDLIKLSQIIDRSKEVLVVVGVTKKQSAELQKRNIVAIEHTKDVDELAMYYSAAHVFINPTYEDTFPTVNIEALACGTPIITYNTGGSGEVINGNCGIVIDKGDVTGMLSAIRSIKKIASECRAVAEKYNAYDKFLNYVQLYKEVLEK